MKQIIINLDDVDEEKFEELRKLSKSKDAKHLIAKALATYDFLIRGKSHENIVIIKSAKGEHEFRIS